MTPPIRIHDVPATRPQLIAPDTWLIPNLAPAGDGLYLPVNSMVIRGREPVIIDTGAPVHRALWLEKVFSVVEPEDMRWIFLSHDDGDHTGALFEVLERCRNATLVTNLFSVERLALEKPALPLERMRWIEPGGMSDPVEFLNGVAAELGVEPMPSLAALMLGDLTPVTD